MDFSNLPLVRRLLTSLSQIFTKFNGRKPLYLMNDISQIPYRIFTQEMYNLQNFLFIVLYFKTAFKHFPSAIISFDLSFEPKIYLIHQIQLDINTVPPSSELRSCEIRRRNTKVLGVDGIKLFCYLPHPDY